MQQSRRGKDRRFAALRRNPSGNRSTLATTCGTKPEITLKYDMLLIYNEYKYANSGE